MQIGLLIFKEQQLQGQPQMFLLSDTPVFNLNKYFQWKILSHLEIRPSTQVYE